MSQSPYFDPVSNVPAPPSQQGTPVYPQGASFGGPGYGPQAPQGYQPGFAPQAPVGEFRAPATSADSFFAALFDFTFTKYVTIGFVRVIYIIGMLICAATWLAFIVAGFAQDGGLGIAMVVVGWIPAFFTLLLMRLGVEFVVATVRTAQNTAAIARNTATMAESAGLRYR